VINFVTPDAVRETSPFKFELYRNYENFVLSGKIAEGERVIEASMFESGVIETGDF